MHLAAVGQGSFSSKQMAHGSDYAGFVSGLIG
jgi:hypothetical protein